MFIKKILKKNRSDIHKYVTYRLCISYRIGKVVRQKTVLHLGKLDELTSEDQFKELADRIDALIEGQSEFFGKAPNPVIEILAQKFYAQLCEKKKTEQKSIPSVRNDSLDDDSLDDDDTLVKLNTLTHNQVREVGAESLCLQTIQKLKLPEFFDSQGWNEKQKNIAITQIIAKAVFPASETKTAQWIEENSAIKELIFPAPVTITRHQLYKSSKRIYQNKENLEKYLSDTTTDLFSIEDKIVLYDLTNTYFEGRKLRSLLAKFGRSKEKRKDAKLIALALVCNQYGFVKYSKIYPGNISDPVTLCETIDELALKTSPFNGKPLVVMDAGISTKANLKLLKEKGYDYLCVTRSKLKEYVVSQNKNGHIDIFDNRQQKIEIQRVEKPGESDSFLYVHSYAKAEKEASMNDRFSQRFEEELKNMESALHTKSGTKKIDKVHERLGRIKERYPSANKHYKIDVVSDGTFATAVNWKRIEAPPNPGDGVYFLRTSKTELSEIEIWDIYNTLTQIEETFRILKTDLHLRPNHHKTDLPSEAHIYLGVVAYMVVATIRHQLKQCGIHHGWQNIVRIMNTQKMVQSSVQDSKGQQLVIKKCSRPQAKVKEIYEALKLKQTPFRTKKFVIPQLRV